MSEVITIRHMDRWMSLFFSSIVYLVPTQSRRVLIVQKDVSVDTLKETSEGMVDTLTKDFSREIQIPTGTKSTEAYFKLNELTII